MSNIVIFCDKHQPSDDLPPLMKRAILHVMTDAIFTSKEFTDIVEELSEEDHDIDIGELTSMWNERYPTACCFLGEDKLHELMTVELQMVLTFGTKVRPVGFEEAFRLGIIDSDGNLL